jgi:hypothetical protein
MIYPVAAALTVISIVLLVLGGVREKPWALYLLKVVWITLSVIALYFTIEAWKGRGHSENWAMFGVLLFVWPISGFVCLSVIVELFILKGKQDIHSRICRVLSLMIAGFLVIISIIPVFS